MNNDKIIIEERNRIHQIMYGKDIISEAVITKVLGSLTDDVLRKTIQNSIKKNIDELVNKAVTKQAAQFAKNSIDDIIKNGGKNYISRASIKGGGLRNLYDDVAKAAFKKDFKQLSAVDKMAVRTQTSIAIKNVDDDILRQSAKNARKRLVKINNYNKFGITALQDSKLRMWWNTLKSKGLNFNRAIAWKWAKRLGIAIGLVLLWANLNKDKKDPTKCPDGQYFDEKTKKCKTPDPVDPVDPSPSLYSNCSSFPYRKGCISPIIGEVQKCLGLSVDDKFGPNTANALSLNNYGNEITEPIYNKIKEKCDTTQITPTPTTTIPLTPEQTYGIEPTPQQFEGGTQTIKINADEI